MREYSRIVSRAIGWLAGVSVITMTLSALAQELLPSNISRYVGDGRWDWTVFIKAAPQLLDRINCVEYTLHPSFPNPVRTVCRAEDPRHPFGLSSNGWGTFEISIKVLFKNGEVRSLKHMLALETPRPVERPLQLRAANTATQVRPGWWDWTVHIEGPNNVLAQIRCVEYTLHPTFPNPVRAVCDRGVGPRAFSLSGNGWGTFKIGIRIIFRDGQIQQLTHNLTF